MKFFKKALQIFSISLFFHLAACGGSSGGASGTAAISFTEVTTQAGLSYALTPEASLNRDKEAGGVAVDDVDGDGYLDFFVTHGTNGAGRLYINNGSGGFVDKTSTSIIDTSSKARGALFVDIDGDGVNELLVSDVDVGAATDAVSVSLVKAFKKTGTYTYTDISSSTGLAYPTPRGSTFSISAADFDKDNDLDLAIAQYNVRPTPDSFDSWLWANNGDGTFNDITGDLPIPPQVLPYQPGLPEQPDPTLYQWNLSPIFSDINGDGNLDLTYAATFTNSKIYLYDGTNFSLLTTGTFDDEAGMGAAIGDYDNDGDFDWFISSIWHPDKSYNQSGTGNSGNRLYKNDGSGVFTDATDEAGVRIGYFGWGACFGDFDNDGDLDLFHTNGFGDNETIWGQQFLYFTLDPSVFYINNGDGTFTEVATEIGMDHNGQGRGVSCFDYDNDGDLDIIIANNGSSPSLYRNDVSQQNNYLDVRLDGLIGNHMGAGSKVIIQSNSLGQQIREIRMGSNYLSNDPVLAHFGLGADTEATQLRIEWYDANDTVTVLNNVQANQTVVVTHPGK